MRSFFRYAVHAAVRRNEQHGGFCHSRKKRAVANLAADDKIEHATRVALVQPARASGRDAITRGIERDGGQTELCSMGGYASPAHLRPGTRAIAQPAERENRDAECAAMSCSPGRHGEL